MFRMSVLFVRVFVGEKDYRAPGVLLGLASVQVVAGVVMMAGVGRDGRCGEPVSDVSSGRQALERVRLALNGGGSGVSTYRELNVATTPPSFSLPPPRAMVIHVVRGYVLVGPVRVRAIGGAAGDQIAHDQR